MEDQIALSIETRSLAFQLVPRWYSIFFIAFSFFAGWHAGGKSVFLADAVADSANLMIAVFIGNILVVGDRAGGIEDDMVVDVIFINVGTDHIFIFSTLHPQIVVPDDVRFRHQFLQA